MPAGTPGSVPVKIKTTNYYGRVPGKREPVPLCANKAAAETMLSHLIGKTALHEAGLDDPFAVHRRRPLVEHLADFLTALRAKGDSQRHVADTDRLVRTFLDGVQAVVAADLDLARAQEWLASLRADRPVPPPGEPDMLARPAEGNRPALPEGWSLAAVAELLGIGAQSVRPLAPNGF